MRSINFFKQLFSRNKNVPSPTAEQTVYPIYTKLLPRRYRTYGIQTNKQRQLRNISRNGIVRRGIERIKQGVGNLPWELQIKGKNPKSVLNQSIIEGILKNPNILYDYDTFWSMVLEDLIVLDAGVFNKVRGGNPLKPLYLYPVDAITIEKLTPPDFTNPKGSLYIQRLNMLDNKEFSSSDMAYLQMNHFTEDSYGLSPVEKLWRYYNYFQDAMDSAADIASIDTSKFILGLEGVTSDEVNKFRQYMQDEIEGSGRIPVVGTGAGGKVTSAQIGAINSDSLFIEWQKFLLTLCAKCFALPESFFIERETNDRNTLDDQLQQVTIEAITPYAHTIEKAINRHIIAELGITDIEFKFIFEESDKQKASRIDRAEKKYTSGGMTENEYRKELGLEPRKTKYSDLNVFESKANMNLDLAPAPSGGFNGLGSKKDQSASKTKKSKPSTG